MPKFIVVTGGVLSGLGKGVASASIGFLLRQYKVIPIKCDGYLNVDPGTLNPIEHGEVYVLEDGGEVDMDFGHYERFLGINCKSEWNLTMGKVFDKIRQKERKGDYLGKTVQMIPHVTSFIKEWWLEIAKKENADIALIEIGGTVGDIENELFIEAARQLSDDVGKDNVLYIHLTYVPVPHNVNEQKTKPTQQSVNLLRERGIQPDIIIGRCEEFLDNETKEKISRFCNLRKDAVISGVDVKEIYEIPLNFFNEGILNIINNKLNINAQPKLEEWKKLVENLKKSNKEIKIALCGKYTKLHDSYASILEALKHCAANLNYSIRIKWLETSRFDKANKADLINDELKNVDGVIVPGGFGSRGVEGKIQIIKYCRENNIPFLGLCLGLQLCIVEFARNVCNLKDANSTEMANTTNPVIDMLPEQMKINMKGGTMRLGAYEASLKEGSIVSRIYNQNKVSERHRHRYEVNPAYHKILEQGGLVFSGTSRNGVLVEFIELPKHKFFVATQAHPEFKSNLLKPAPLFYAFVKACANLSEF